MKNNFNPKNVKFFVNESERKVVCVIEGTESDLLDFIREKADFSSFPWLARITPYDEITTMPNRFVGIATCSQEDEWDEKIGRAFAYARARHQYDKAFFSKAQQFITKIGNYLDRLVDVINLQADHVQEQTDFRAERLQQFFPNKPKE